MAYVPPAEDPLVISMAAEITDLHRRDPDRVAAQKVAIAGLFLIVCDAAARDGALQQLLAEAEGLRALIHRDSEGVTAKRVLPNIIHVPNSEVPRA